MKPKERITAELAKLEPLADQLRQWIDDTEDVIARYKLVCAQADVVCREWAVASRKIKTDLAALQQKTTADFEALDADIQRRLSKLEQWAIASQDAISNNMQRLDRDLAELAELKRLMGW